jgi:hypothetical protein
MGNCCGSAATAPSKPIVATPLQPELPRPVKTVQTNHQASKSSLDGSCQKSSAVSSSHGSNEKLARATVQDNRETVTSTSSSKPLAPIPSRALSQDWESSQRHRDGTDYPASFGDAFASQDPYRQETVPQRTRVHTPGRMNRRMKSETLSSNGHTPQFGPFLTPGAGQPVEGQEGRPRFPSTLQSLLSNDFRYAVGRCPISLWLLSSIVHRFRILVVGKVRVRYQTDPRRN